MKKELLKKHYKEHRPVLHFTSKGGWINDPNGLIYYNGYYHLYYQYYPNGVIHGPMHWGHARTNDFLNWEELPIALYPDENGTIFSGCMVYDKDNTSGFGKDGKAPMVAIFTHNLEKDGTKVQFQSLAYSLDEGMSFIKYEANPVLDLKLEDFRDPKVFWNSKKKHWVMLVSSGKEIMLFYSDNLKNWNSLSDFSITNMKPDEIWECPDLLELTADNGEKKWVLFVSQNTLDYGKTGVRYFIGNFDGNKFDAESGIEEELYLDFGRDNYAAATYVGTADRVIQQAWMNCWAYAVKLPETGFRGSMTLPKEISIRKTKAGYRIIQTPVHEWKTSCKQYELTEVNDGLKIEGMPGIYKITLPSDEGQIIFQNSDSYISIYMDYIHGKITVDRSRCADVSFGPYFHETGFAYFHGKKDRSIYVVLDVTSLEIFAAEGEAVGTFQYFSEKPFEQIRITGGRT